MDNQQRVMLKNTKIYLQKNIWRKTPIYLMIMPCVLLLILFMVYPIYQTILFSVNNVKLPSFDLEFAGLGNFIDIFSKGEISTVFNNTFIWIVGSIVFKFFLGFWAAITFNVNVRGGVLFRIFCLLPWTVPTIVASNLWRWILQTDTGLLNVFFKSYGMGAFAQNWLGNPDLALLSVMVANAWSGFPFVMLMLLAGMQGVPKELYEAGAIDGANKVDLFRYITIPSLKPIIVIILLLDIINNLNSFDLIYVLTGGGPGGASETLGLFIYRIGFNNFDFGGASAISFALLVFAIISFGAYIYFNNKVKSRGVEK